MTEPSNTTNRKLPLMVGSVLIAAIWLAVFTALTVMQPELKMRMVVIAFGAGATELVLYVGAAWFGISLFNRFRSFLSRRSD